MIQLVFVVAFQNADAGSATWVLHPSSGDWNQAANWTPAQIPNGPTDSATFGVSDITNLSVGKTAIEVNGVVFNPGASAFTTTVTYPAALFTISGAGVINNSGTMQNFVTPTSASGPNTATTTFTGNASAGALTTFTNQGSAGPPPGLLQFLSSSSAGSAMIFNNGGIAPTSGGATRFSDSATAANSTIVCRGGTVGSAQGGTLYVLLNSTADHSTITLEGAGVAVAAGGVAQLSDSATAANANIFVLGGSVSGAGGGSLQFYAGACGGDATITLSGPSGGSSFGGSALFDLTSTAGNAFLTADSGSLGAAGSTTVGFYSDSTGGTARVRLLHTGTLNIGAHNVPGVTIGSLEGDGIAALGVSDHPGQGRNLTIGSNNLSTTFSGTIQDNGGGSLTKLGNGRLTLTGPSTYTRHTSVQAGQLLISNLTGSGTGTGPVQVNGGTLGGSGTIAGPVTVGRGTGRAAFISPGNGDKSIGALTIQSALTCRANCIYSCGISRDRGTADRLVASGTTIAAGAMISLSLNGTGTLAQGTVFILLDNTSANPIAGTFANLPDGGIVTVGGLNFQANYEGGDGNDLTLTVL